MQSCSPGAPRLQVGLNVLVALFVDAVLTVKVKRSYYWHNGIDEPIDTAEGATDS